MIDNYPQPTRAQSDPASMDSAQRLATYKRHYEVIYKTLRVERGHRQMRLKAALTPEQMQYWQDRINEVNAALESLVVLKEIGKAALLAGGAVAEAEWAQGELIGGGEEGKIRSY